MGRIKNEFNLQGQLKFIYNQIIHSIPKSWKDALTANFFFFQRYHLIKHHQTYCLEKLKYLN